MPQFVTNINLLFRYLVLFEILIGIPQKYNYDFNFNTTRYPYHSLNIHTPPKPPTPPFRIQLDLEYGENVYECTP